MADLSVSAAIEGLKDAFRDLLNTSSPGQGLNNPDKTQIRSAFDGLKTAMFAMESVIVASANTFATKALMDATAAATVVGTFARVTADGNPNNNGIYIRATPQIGGAFDFYSQGIATIIASLNSLNDNEIGALAAQTAAADRLFYFTGPGPTGHGAMATFTAAARSLVAAADDIQQRTVLKVPKYETGVLTTTDYTVSRAPASRNALDTTYPGGWYLPNEPAIEETTSFPSPAQIEWAQNRAMQLRANAITSSKAASLGLQPIDTGILQVIGQGQSFMAGSLVGVKVLLTSTALTGITYWSLMLGDSDRTYGTGTTYDVVGTNIFKPLQSSVIVDGTSTAYSPAVIAAGDYSTAARGETPVVAFCIVLELLLNTMRGRDQNRKFVGTNCAKNGALLTQISTSPTIDRVYDSMTKTIARATAEYPALPRSVGIILDSHGQSDESAGTLTETYMTGHNSLRGLVFARAAQPGVYAQMQKPLCIALQAGGEYTTDLRLTQVAQHRMAMDNVNHPDYHLAGPSGPHPTPADLVAPYPWAGNTHKFANGQNHDGIIAAVATAMLMAGPGWIHHHIGEAYFIGNVIIALHVTMVPPILEATAPSGVVMTTFANKGFDVEDTGWQIDIVSVTKIHDCITMIVCKDPLMAPILGTGDPDHNDGQTNYIDSMSVQTLAAFDYKFNAGYTDTNLDAAGYDDVAQVENIVSLVGPRKLGNRLCTNRVTCLPFPISIAAGV